MPPLIFDVSVALTISARLIWRARAGSEWNFTGSVMQALGNLPTNPWRIPDYSGFGAVEKDFPNYARAQ